jgi:hypothetical protein
VKLGELDLWQVMQRMKVVVAVLAATAFQAQAGSFDWLCDVTTNDEIARREAQSLVWDGVPHSLSARFEKVKILDKERPFYLFHVVTITPGISVKRDRSSYLVCFKLAERTTEFRIVTVIQYASDPPTEQEITIDKRLNRWPVAPPWKTEDDLPHNIKPPGLSIVLDQCRALSSQ